MRDRMTIGGAIRSGAMALGLVLCAAGSAFAQTPADLQAHIDRLEAVVRTLTGQIEELTFRIDQLERQLLERGVTVAETPPLVAVGEAPPLRIDLGPTAPLAAATPPAIGAPLDLGQLMRGGAPLNLAQPALQGPQMTSNPVADYERIYQSILNGDYAIAEAGFRAFLVAYPGHPLAIDAQYWLAESLFSRELHREAAEAFLTAYRLAPNGDKAPDALLKLGISLVALGQTEAGCSSFAQVLREFPRASNALKQRVAVEQANARCA